MVDHSDLAGHRQIPCDAQSEVSSCNLKDSSASEGAINQPAARAAVRIAHASDAVLSYNFAKRRFDL